LINNYILALDYLFFKNTAIVGLFLAMGSGHVTS